MESEGMKEVAITLIMIIFLMAFYVGQHKLEFEDLEHRLNYVEQVIIEMEKEK